MIKHYTTSNTSEDDQRDEEIDTDDESKEKKGGKEVDESLKKPIILKRIKFKYNYAYGSADSMNLLMALNNSEHKEIFATEALSHLIKYKWRYI